VNRQTVLFLLTTVALIILGSTVFFHYVEGWSWLDSYFFTVVTLTTVGYGSLVPVTAVGKIATTILIFVGVGVVATIIQQISRFTVQSRVEARKALMEARQRAAEAEKRAMVAEEKGPDA
jgi:voltage-gated potassium channel